MPLSLFLRQVNGKRRKEGKKNRRLGEPLNTANEGLIHSQSF